MNEYFLKIKGKDIKSNLVNLSHLVFEVTDASQEAFGKGGEQGAGGKEQEAKGSEKGAAARSPGRT